MMITEDTPIADTALPVEEFKAQNPPESEASQKSVLGRLVYSVDDDGNPPTEAQLIDNIRFILFAGFDTTKSSFGAISLYLSEHPKVYELLVEEVQTFADPLDFDELKAAPILNAVLAETWRLNAPLNSHVVDVDIVIRRVGQKSAIGRQGQIVGILGCAIERLQERCIVDAPLPNEPVVARREKEATVR